MRAAVLGSPIAHSLSPVLHTAAYRELGLSGWTYEAIECDEAGLPGLLASLGPNWAGLSLTMPLKRAVLPLLDGVEPLAEQVGGANTVLLADGLTSGYNTDVPGMAKALRDAGVGLLGDVLVLGGGATASAAVAALRQAGAAEVTVAVRDRSRARDLLMVADRVGLPVRLAPFGLDEPQAAWLDELRSRRWTLLLSTVPAGAADEWAGLLAGGDLVAGTVFDVIYHPWPTRLAEAAAAAGLQVIGGFQLLLNQAAGQVRLMTGLEPPFNAMASAGLTALRRAASR